MAYCLARSRLAIARKGNLDQLNEKHATASGAILHPTKGWRRLNPKRDIASMLIAERHTLAYWMYMGLRRRA